MTTTTAPTRSETSRLRRFADGAEPVAAKVPEVTAAFWVLKLLTTGLGEAASDFLGNVFVPLAAVVGVGGLWFTLRRQLRAPAYDPRTYWSAVLMVAVFGTMVADGLKDGTGIGYGPTTAFCAVGVATIFALWHRDQGTLSIHAIDTRRRERWYWGAVLATFALGTAAGDLTAITFNLGFLASVWIFGAIIAVPALAWWRFGLHPVIAFWACYVVTRPVGASVADWLAKPVERTGLGLGDGTVTALGLVLFVVLVQAIAPRRAA